MNAVQTSLLGSETEAGWRSHRSTSLEEELRDFREFGHSSSVVETVVTGVADERIVVPTFVNEFWTSKQRAANSLHEISYRACFKPQLPRFFIERLTQPGDHVYDPFMGRGTTLLEAALAGRVPLGCDVNPLSGVLLSPRLNPPALHDLASRLGGLDLSFGGSLPEELLVFYHPKTLAQICGLRDYLLQRNSNGTLDDLDRWIRMVAVNRLTGHSPGFFSVYTLPPNQAVSVEAQRKINMARHQVPEPRSVPKLILEKSRSLLVDCAEPTRKRLHKASGQALLLTKQSSATPEIPPTSVSLVVTSPPFLNVVDYAGDNWLRCWFCGIDPQAVSLTVPSRVRDWEGVMTATFRELRRVLGPGGHIAFEVGEVRGGKVKLEQSVLRCGVAAGLAPRLALINTQEFTKTSNCWGILNGKKGTNTNRIVLFRKE